MTTAAWVVPAAIGMAMAACVSTGPVVGTPAPAAPAVPAASPVAAAQTAAATVSGTVTYRERMALSPDATVEVWIVDTSPGIGTMAILTQTTVAAEGRQVPLPFELHVDPSRVEQRRAYGLKAVIRAGGQMLFANADPVPVLTLGHPSLVALTLARVPQDALAGARPPR